MTRLEQLAEATEPDSILIVRLKCMGDVVMTLPLVHRLRDNFPRTRLSFLVSSENAPLLQGFADVDEVIILNRAPFRHGTLREMWHELRALYQQLRHGRFAMALDLQGYGETAGLVRLTSAPVRWGRGRNFPRRWAYTLPPMPAVRMHPAQWNLSLLDHGGIAPQPVRNEFRTPVTARRAAEQFLHQHELKPDRPLLFIQPFTSTPLKNWPLANYLAVAHTVRTQGGQVLFGGGPRDEALLEPARQQGFAVAAGQPLLTMAGLMQHAALVLGSDTGLLHLAVAQGRRVLMLLPAAMKGLCPFQHPNWAFRWPDAHQVADIPAAAVGAEVNRILAPAQPVAA